MSRSTGRWLLASSLVLAVGIPSIAVGAGEGRSLIAGKRNPARGAIERETQVIGSSATYGTRQSNVRDGDGGGAIYGCRSTAGREPCIRVNNLKGGRAFEFSTTGGEAGRITTATPAGAPFTTNATGVASGLNADAVDGRQGADLLGKGDKATDADKLDGRDSADFAAAGDLKYARVNEGGELRSGFTRGATGSRREVAPNTYIVTFDQNVRRCSATSTVLGGDGARHQAAVVTPDDDGNSFRVDFDGTEPVTFYLQVIC